MSENDEFLFGNRTERLQNGLKLFDRTNKDLEQDLEIIKEWVNTQQHLPEIPS